MDTLTIILDLISKKGIPESKFEKDLMFPRSSVNDWKIKKTKSYMKKISEIADYFNVSVDFLLGKQNTVNNVLLIDKIDSELFEKIKKLSKEQKKELLKYLSKS